MSEVDPTPRRFRRRLTAVFVLVAAASAGLVAVVTVVLAHQSRWRGARETSLEEARFALAVSPSELDPGSIDRFRAVYERRSDANILAVQDDRVLVSSAGLQLDDVPGDLADLGPEPVIVDGTVDGQPMLVAGGVGRDGVRYYLFFSLDELQRSLNDLARLAAMSWFVTVLLAGAVGNLVARRTLRPVADAAAAAEAIAAGDLTTRLPEGATDEFGLLATSFNHMADEVQSSLERLAAAAHRERRFTADVAHELRTPLTGMSASAALLRDHLDDLPEPAQRPATILVRDVARLRQLVLELLELAALDAATDSPRRSAVHVRTAVDAAVAATRSGASVDIDVDVDPELTIIADAFAIQRILTNLLDNAISHGGGAPVRVVGAVADGWLRIDVIDGGPGIKPEDVDKVFDRFYKSDNSRSRGGSGLGLAIAREYATREGGSLTVTSVLGQGATFSLRLQHRPATTTPGMTPAEPSPPTPSFS